MDLLEWKSKFSDLYNRLSKYYDDFGRHRSDTRTPAFEWNIPYDISDYVLETIVECLGESFWYGLHSWIQDIRFVDETWFAVVPYNYYSALYEEFMEYAYNCIEKARTMKRLEKCLGESPSDIYYTLSELTNDLDKIDEIVKDSLAELKSEDFWREILEQFEKDMS